MEITTTCTGKNKNEKKKERFWTNRRIWIAKRNWSASSFSRIAKGHFKLIDKKRYERYVCHHKILAALIFGIIGSMMQFLFS
mmetsp:Transcript_35928/g.48230  ORF Transcript_35928/g.48230 Transcript_35928/m.48230 type:complete len:82 (+) Transcript_35928:502-747(+)